MSINASTFKPRIDEELQTFLPELTSDELELLTRNCKNDPKHELMPPVQVCPEMNYAIIDGHHQYTIRKQHKLEIRYADVSLPGGIPDAVVYLVHIQMGRRNLSPSQRSSIIAAAVKRYGYGGDRKSGSQATVGAKTLDEMAAMAGVSKRTQIDATKVVNHGAAPIAEAVITGKFTVSDAANVVDLPKDQQEQIADHALANGATLSKAKDLVVRRPPRPGQAFVPTKLLKLATNAFGVLIRLLDKLGIGDECGEHMDAILAAIKNCEDRRDEENKVPF